MTNRNKRARHLEHRTGAIDLGDGPVVMAILNVTPDSFSDGGEAFSKDSALSKASRLIEEGATILDIGGESTRPGGKKVEADEEIQRVAPIVELIKREFDIPVSVDTSKASVAKAVLEVGADIINDISGFRFDPEMANAVAESNAGCVLMHLTGSSFDSMHEQSIDGDPAIAVTSGLKESVKTAAEAGIGRSKICVDVGIGFGKTAAQNFGLLCSLDSISDCFPGTPMLVGVSRKSFLGNATGIEDPSKRVAATCAANTIALCKGADILRVHDVEEAIQTIRVVRALKEAK